MGNRAEVGEEMEVEVGFNTEEQNVYQLGCHSHMRQKNDDGTFSRLFPFFFPPSLFSNFFFILLLISQALLFRLVSIPLLFTQNTQHSCAY